MSGVRGPNSALTEFLRSQGINANEIRLRHERRQRRRGSRRDSNAEDEDEESEPEQTETTSSPPRNVSQDPEVEAIAEAAARKRRADEDEAANEGTDLCAQCHSRFTLTVYTRETKDGFLCRNCSSAVGKSAPKAAKAKAAKRQRKKLAADLLELRNSTAPSLQDYCINLIAEYIDDVDEIGDLTATSVAKLGRILCKNRRLTPRTLQLLLRRDVVSLELSDCSQLTAEAFNLIPAMCPNLKKLTLEMCGQLTGENLVRFAQQLPNLEEIHLDGAFLVRKSAWMDLLDIAGPRLKALTIKSVYRVDAEVLALLVEACADSLEYLSLHRLSQMTDDAPLFMLGSLSKLQHLELVELEPEAWTDQGLMTTLNMIGSQLRELVIRGAEGKLGDAFIDAVAASCGSLTRLELQNLTKITEEAVVHMFGQWMSRESNEGLTSLCLERCIQLGDKALAAALAHSKLTLVDLNINALKKVTFRTLEVLALLPQLTRLDMGFVGSVDPVNIYQLATSKTLKQVLAFGNIRLSDMPLPTGLTVVGTM